MRVLMVVLAAGLLAGCGSSTPEVSTPTYPQVAGTWSDPDGQMNGCMGEHSDRVVMTIEQAGASLFGEFKFRYNGSYIDFPFSARVSETGRITGEAGRSSVTFDVEMEKYGSLLVGGLRSAEASDCVDGSGSKRWTFSVDLERE